jgi:hypothetical protein
VRSATPAVHDVANKKLVDTVEIYKERTVDITALVDKYKHLDRLHQVLQEDHAFALVV